MKPTSRTSCRMRIFDFFDGKQQYYTALQIGRACKMQPNTVIKEMKFILDSGYDVQKGWKTVYPEGLSKTRVRTYMLDMSGFWKKQLHLI